MGHPRLLALALLLAAASNADPIHPIAQGAFQHHDSGWIFPQQLAGFSRVGVPQDLDGSRDAVAYYARTEQGVRSTAVVDVHPMDSAVGALTLAKAEAELERERSVAAAKKARTRLEVRKQPALEAAKTSYRTSTVTTNVYFVASGEWIVTIHISSARLTGQVLDDFVRAQRWESLGNSLSD